MGVSLHIELRNFMLLLRYPEGLSKDQCIDMIYDRGFEETFQTSFPYNEETGQNEKVVEKRIASHIHWNYYSLENRIKQSMEDYGVNTIEEVIKAKREKDSDKNYPLELFNPKDGKAYFVPGEDKDSIKSWDSGGLDYAFDKVFRYVKDENYPTYEEMKKQKPNGWENHGQQVILYYIEKFPGNSAHDILKAVNRGTLEEWSDKFIDWLKEIKVK